MTALQEESEKTKHHIFVVDDEQDILEYYEDVLSDDNHVKTFQSPQAFLQYFDQPGHIEPQLVISDYNMPKMNGLEMIVQVQKKGLQFPFILLSGYLNKEVALQAVDAGVYRLLEKPLHPDLLMDAVDQLLIEYDIFSVRKEISSLTGQLRELYSGIRLIMDQYIPEDIMNRMIVETKNGKVSKKLSFDDMLNMLEGRLDHLLMSEKVLAEMKLNKTKSPK